MADKGEQEAGMGDDSGEEEEEEGGGSAVGVSGTGSSRPAQYAGSMRASSSVFPLQFSSFPASIAPSPVARPGPSLFPSAGNMDPKPDATQSSWLSNSSFSENLLPPPPSLSASKAIEHLCGKESLTEFEKREGSKTQLAGAGKEPGTESASSISDSDVSGGEREGEVGDLERAQRKKRKEKQRRKQKKEERKKRRVRKDIGDKRQIGLLEGHSHDRKSAVKTWVDGKASIVKEYYFDSRGDRDNLAFGSLYRMDVARYSLQQSEAGAETEDTRKRNATTLDVPEADGSVQENKAYRYWSGEAMALETKRDFKRIRIHPVRPPRIADQASENFSMFIPVGSGGTEKEGAEEGESWDDYITRRTREYNTLTRERPADESTWLGFANFQDELIQAAQKKGVKQQAIEKKISVLEKALEHHADSVELTLLYLQACSLRDTVEETLVKWEKAVARLSGSYRFWKELLRFICSHFSLFSVSTVRTMFTRALGGLTAARDQLQNGKIEEEVDKCKDLIKNAELAIVAILADRCRFELQTGHAELALGIFQAAMEYSLFAPLIQPNESNKRRLFEAFWESQAPRIGEEGALGWASWLEREEEQIQIARAHETAVAEEQPGGWTGWSEQLVHNNVGNNMGGEGHVGGSVGNSAREEGEEEDEGADEMEVDEDEGTLLAKLGLSSIDAGKELEVTDVGVWQRWAVEERKRGPEQWLPVHAQMGRDAEQDEQLEKMVVFEDIRDTLVSVVSEGALCRLIGHFLEFCNIPLPDGCSSNELSTQQGLDGLESLTSSLARLRGSRYLGGNIPQHMVDSAESCQGSSGEAVLRSLVGDQEWFMDSFARAQFVCNVLLLLQTSCAKPLSRSHWGLTEILLTIQGLASESGVKGSRALAKKLLKTHRQDIALWTAYAIVEGAAGHIEIARKVLDTTLASLLALPNELQEDTPLLYLACADMEVSYGSRTRALHILCYFGAGISYTLSSSAVDDPVPPTLIVKARLGFQQHLQNVRKARTYVRDPGFFFVKRSGFGGALDERGVAMVACVALFEELSIGWEAAISVFEESLAFTLPGRRKESKDCEALMERYINLMQRNMPLATPAQVRQRTLRGLVEYPYNSALLGVLVQTSSSTYYLRRFFDDSLKKNPSTLLWMYALAIELGNIRMGTAARIRSLFERALETKATQQSVVLWRTYLAYEFDINHNVEGARRVYFRAIHACPWSKMLWLDGFTRLSHVLTAKELAEFQEIMRDKELRLRTDVYEILLEDAEDQS